MTADAKCLLFRHYKPVRERYAFLVGLVRLGPLTASSTTLPDAVWGMGHGAVLGDEGKAVGCVPPTALLCLAASYIATNQSLSVRDQGDKEARAQYYWRA